MYYIYTYIYICTYTYICIYIHICVCVCVFHTHTFTHSYIIYFGNNCSSKYELMQVNHDLAGMSPEQKRITNVRRISFKTLDKVQLSRCACEIDSR